jgi:hypothetical protein
VQCAACEDGAAVALESLAAYAAGRPRAGEAAEHLRREIQAAQVVLAGAEDAAAKLDALADRAAGIGDALRYFENSSAPSPECDEVIFWAGRLIQSMERRGAEVRDSGLAEKLRELADRAADFVANMNFAVLYDQQRKLFPIGYRLPDVEGPGRYDVSFYDLLGSEARLASFVAIAKGDVPQEHWFHLGRQLVSAGGRPTLVSWSASMFEYLMPLLLTRTYPGTLLEQTCANVVRTQIDYANDRGVPWGMSEAAFNYLDRHGQYQYKAFGVPGLGLKRGLADDLVVSPYATMLAAMVDPEQALRNMLRLSR